MSTTGRLDFTDLDSPQAMPPAARAEREHRRHLASVHTELHTAPPHLSHSERRAGMSTPESYRGLESPGDRATLPASPTTPMSDEDMVAVLTARLQDAMDLIGLQQQLLKERKLEAARQAATQQAHADHVDQQQSAETDDNACSNYGDELRGAEQVQIIKPPKIKDIRCRKFAGTEVYPGLGGGLEDFINEFERAVKTEKQLNGSTWTPILKASILGNFLEGDAHRSYHDFAGDRDITYDELAKHLKGAFGCHLSQYELRKRLDTPKRSGDTWQQYTRYLQFIERLMEGDQTQLLLETVCQNACPELTSTLLS
eukprot:jgi/Phyca11/574599/estExt2_Genewise1.C_PHYCAscaffold_640076